MRKLGTVTELHPEGESVVSVTPSKLTWVLIGLGGIFIGISLGWYMAGGMKIEQEFFRQQNSSAAPTDAPPPRDTSTVEEPTEDQVAANE